MNLIEQRYAISLRTYRFKIRHFAKQHERQIPGFTVEDLEQEFKEVLYRVVDKYDPNNGAKFNTFFWQCVRNRMADLTKKAHAEKRKSEWFEFDGELDPDAVSEVVRAMEAGDWQQMERMDPEDWYLLRETIIERYVALQQTA